MYQRIAHKRRVHFFDVVIKTVSFDLQKIVNPAISGREYQQGEQAGFENVKMFVRYRDRYTCRMCQKNSQRLEVHHIKPRSHNGGSSPGNLITLCQECHEKIKGQEEQYCEQFRAAIGSAGKDLAKTAQVNSFKESILANIALPHEETFGYITKDRRKTLGLPKNAETRNVFCILGEANLPFDRKGKPM